jgi:methanogenic corrinoid protein MtbC1
VPLSTLFLEDAEFGFDMSWFKALREKEPSEPANPIGTVVIGTLHPDLIDTAKEMVRKSLKNAQFKTVDAGKGASAAAFVSKAKEANAHYCSHY